MSIETPICMICQEDTQTSTNPFLSPCRCKGSIALIHRECLENWILHSNKVRCSVCQTKYRIRIGQEEVQPDKTKLVIRSVFYTILGFLFLTAAFSLFHPATYEFGTSNLFQATYMAITTTYAHLGVHIWMLFLCVIGGLTILMYLFAFLAMFVGEFEPMSTLSHTQGDAELFNLLEKTLTSYPLQTPIVPYLGLGMISFILTAVITYGCYKILLSYNPPTRRVRILL